MPTEYYRVTRRADYIESDGTLHKWSAGTIITSDDFDIGDLEADPTVLRALAEQASKDDPETPLEYSVCAQGVPLEAATESDYQTYAGRSYGAFKLNR